MPELSRPVFARAVEPLLMPVLQDRRITPFPFGNKKDPASRLHGEDSPISNQRQPHRVSFESRRPRPIMPFTVERASPSDARAIADIYQDRQVTAWNRLTHGTVDPSVFNAGLEDMFAESLRDPDEILFVARDEDHPDRMVVSYVNLVTKPALAPMTEEEIKQQTAKYHARLMPGLNGPLLIEMWEKLDRMREQVLAGRGRHWFLDNVGTLQAYQGKGIATMLLRRVLAEYPDRDGVPIFLDTSGDEDGRAWPLYERLGFAKVGGFEIDMAPHGGEGVHHHLGMLREPQGAK